MKRLLKENQQRGEVKAKKMSEHVTVEIVPAPLDAENAPNLLSMNDKEYHWLYRAIKDVLPSFRHAGRPFRRYQAFNHRFHYFEAHNETVLREQIKWWFEGHEGYISAASLMYLMATVQFKKTRPFLRIDLWDFFYDPSIKITHYPLSDVDD